MSMVRALVVRPVLLVAWAVVLWGTLLLASIAVHVFRLGPGAAWEAALRLSTGNLLCMALAVAAWVSLAAALAGRRLGGDAEG
ncbi:MAG TPA: hypothetical protein VFM29_07645 [Vicinamibacteria bacterium]|nr:hypothetical protein [Vicinamibacteria bacterium]